MSFRGFLHHNKVLGFFSLIIALLVVAFIGRPTQAVQANASIRQLGNDYEITGTVTNPSGNRVKGARVRISREEIDAFGQSSTDVLGSTRSNGNGEFSFIVPAVAAASTNSFQLVNSNTGPNSTNRNTVRFTSSSSTRINNQASVNNSINAAINTGGNTSSNNTVGGSIITGSVNLVISVDNRVNTTLPIPIFPY